MNNALHLRPTGLFDIFGVSKFWVCSVEVGTQHLQLGAFHFFGMPKVQPVRNLFKIPILGWFFLESDPRFLFQDRLVKICFDLQNFKIEVVYFGRSVV